MRYRSVIAAVLVVAALGGAGLAGAQSGGYVSGHPELDAYAPQNTLVPGTDTSLTVQVANDGTVNSGNPTNRDIVTTARSVRLEVDADDAPVEIDTDAQSIGSVSEATPSSTDIDVTVPENAEPGVYTLDATLRYSYVASYAETGGVQNEVTEEVTRELRVVVDDDPRFRLDTLDSDVQVGESGTLNVSVENVGGERASALDVQLEPTGTMIDFGGGASGSARVEALAPGESETVQYDVTVSPDAVAGGYSLDGTVEYTTVDGVRQTDDRAALSTGIYPTPERDDFIVEMATDSVTAGETVPIDVTVTNNRNERITDIEGKLFADDPLSSEDDEGFAGALDPGESTTMTFELTAASGATEKVFPVSMDFRYDDAEDDSRISDTYRVPVQVTEPEESTGPPIALIGGAVLVLLVAGGGYYLLRGRNEA